MEYTAQLYENVTYHVLTYFTQFTFLPDGLHDPGSHPDSFCCILLQAVCINIDLKTLISELVPDGAPLQNNLTGSLPPPVCHETQVSIV